MDYVPDPGELIDMRGERIADDLFRDGAWHCCNCKKRITPGHEQAMSADPAAAPACRACAERAGLQQATNSEL